MSTSDPMSLSDYPPLFLCLHWRTGLSASKIGTDLQSVRLLLLPQACAAFARYLEIPQFAGGPGLQGACGGYCISDSRISEL